MAGIIVFENTAPEATLRAILDSAGALDCAVTLVGSRALATDYPEVTFVEHKAQLLGTAIAQSLEASNESKLLLVDASFAPTTDQLQAALIATMELSAQIGLFSFENDQQVWSLEDISEATVFQQLGKQSVWPTSLVATTSDLLAKLTQIEVLTPRDLAAKLLIIAVSEGEAVDTCVSTLAISEEQLNEEAFHLSNLELAGSLRFAVNLINIEELFPDHNWNIHETESAAACYHTLAAQFIRFEDFDSAVECLGYSDQLEDSPRSLALKGLIALNRGETLTAVANMVSSLQEYERRKKNPEKQHYLTFTPKDLETINSSLQSGLEALNLRDNELAVDHFTDAVFNFDSFYSDCGLTLPKNAVN